MFKLLELYKHSLTKRPHITNAIMTGSLFGIGDVVAQLLFSHSEYPSSDNYNIVSDNDVKDLTSYDYLRTLRAITYGSLIFSFIGKKWYNILHYNVRFSHIHNSHWKNQILRVSVDQILFAPISLPFYFCCMTIMEGQSIAVAKKKLDVEWWNTLKVNWTIWPLFQMINFSFIPLQHQLLAVNVIAIFWNAFLSYKNSITALDKEKRIVHYPPVTE
ncbi:ethanol metabolism protein PWA37_003699 [Arxiozyma heterogenica]|uniref:Protein SYM1 n=1 Tax=Arxiozyma heterogenica TaxID=278026 RepID=A0AAN7WNS3_9SACH|nr:hypothetical protein RI543_001089 [Kazachstania heterogenica]